MAEYTALLLALQEAHRLAATEVDLRLDSKLIVEQLHGRWRVKDAKLQPLHAEARRLLAGFARWKATHEPRATNRAADALANLALDDPAAAARLRPATAPDAAPRAVPRGQACLGRLPSRVQTAVLPRQVSCTDRPLEPRAVDCLDPI